MAEGVTVASCTKAPAGEIFKVTYRITTPTLPLPAGCEALLTAVHVGEGVPWPVLELALRFWQLEGRTGLPWDLAPEGYRAIALGFCLRSSTGIEIEGWWAPDEPRLGSLHVPSGTAVDAALDEVPRLLKVWRAIMRAIRRGRPLGSGTFPSREECLAALRDAAQAVRRQGKRPTQGNVAELLRERGLIAAAEPLETLLYWLRHYGIGWRDAVS